jgi:Flp pilus assembly pilin Flp
MFANSLFAPVVGYLRVMLSTRLAEARSEDRERGASVVEWVVITTIVVVLAVTIGVIITNALTTKAGDISTCINNAGTTSGCSGSN